MRVGDWVDGSEMEEHSNRAEPRLAWPRDGRWRWCLLADESGGGRHARPGWVIMERGVRPALPFPPFDDEKNWVDRFRAGVCPVKFRAGLRICIEA